jgi:hypothetical protein
MFSSFFASVAYLWYVYYLVGYAVCLRRIYEAETGREIALESKKIRRTNSPAQRATTPGFPEVETAG